MNVKSFQQVLGDHTGMHGSAKDSCSLFYKQVVNPMESLRDCARNCDVRSSKSLFLLEGKLSQCPIPTLSLLMNKTDQYDYTRNFVQEILTLNKEKHLDP